MKSLANRVQAWLCCGLALCLPLAASAGQIALYPMEARVVAGTGKMPVLTVSNPGEDKAYVKTEVREILFPNTAREKEVLVTGTSESDLIASPARFILAPNGSKKIRLVYLNTVDKERIFRVYATPIVDSNEQAALSRAINQQNASQAKAQPPGGVQTSLSISISWGALIRLLPEAPKLAWSASVRDGMFYLKNSGNIRFHVSAIKNCTDSANCPKTEKDGKSEEFNIYPDLERKIGSASAPQRLEFDISDGDGGKAIHVLARDLLSGASAP
jgi:P pilus assembly chaperone PapD